MKARVKATGEIVEVDDALSITIERKLVKNLTKWFDTNFYQAGSERLPEVFSFFDLMEDARQSLMEEIEKTCIDLTKE